MAQAYTNDQGYTCVYPMKLRSQAHQMLSTFIHEVGIPAAIHSDDAPELMQGKYKNFVRSFISPVPIQSPTAHGRTGQKIQLENSKDIPEGRWMPTRFQGVCGTFVSNGLAMSEIKQ